MQASSPSRRQFVAASGGLLYALFNANAAYAEPLAGTMPLTTEGDLARKMVDGLHTYLDRELAAVAARRLGAVDVPSQRTKLQKMLGVVDERLPITELAYVGDSEKGNPLARTDSYDVYEVRWPVLRGLHGEGLLLHPKAPAKANVVCTPDADWTFPPKGPGVALLDLPPAARLLAHNGCQVVIPAFLDRKDTWSVNERLNRQTNQPHREFVYRMAYELGRHVIGYELQKVLALVDWYARSGKPIGIYGEVEGGLLALYAGALDPRITSTCACGYGGPEPMELWQEPIYRNVWGLAKEFDLSVLAAMILPRALTFCERNVPTVEGPPQPRQGRGGAAPGRLTQPNRELVQARLLAAAAVHEGLPPERKPQYYQLSDDVKIVVDHLRGTLNVAASELPERPPLNEPDRSSDPTLGSHRQFAEMVALTQQTMRDCESARQRWFWSKLDLKSLEKYQESIKPFRTHFHEETIGKLPPITIAAQPRTRPLHDQPTWRSYEITLDTYPDVFAQGILTVPKDLKDGERRPVVVCQHGLEGRPKDVVSPQANTRYYNSFGSALADRGYVVFAPQNPYIFQNHFRQLQRKANPLKLSLFSFIVRQHERILDWLCTLPYVDPERIGFYGLSYGGKTAMRVPALLERYCLSICSGDFNEWVWKNASYDFNGSYVYSGEYEISEFDLGHTFNYAEMAALIAPRPFMVERGHDDGVGIDEWVAYEYAKVRRLYAKLGIPDRTAIEFFNGGHEINGKGTFAFLAQHLRWHQAGFDG